MRKYFFIVFFLAAGCTTPLAENMKTVADSYEALVLDDGVSLEEAKTVAQKALIKQNLVRMYELDNPQLEKDIAELPNHEDYWFIFFEEEKTASIEFIFMVIINKETGSIKFANDYPLGKRWILEAALLR